MTQPKLTPEGAAAKAVYDEQCTCGDYYPADWNAIASAAVEASEEVKRLRARVAELEDAELHRPVWIQGYVELEKEE